jgi:hypothetical protein
MGHTLGGNCWHERAIHGCHGDESGAKCDPCDVCHEHCEPRGECEECPPCEACDEEGIER